MKKTAWTSFLCILLLATMLLATACGGQSNTPATSTADPNASGGTPNEGEGSSGAENKEDLTKLYPKTNMGGRDFVHLHHGNAYDWKTQSDPGDPISYIHYQQRMAFEEWCDVNLSLHGVFNVVQTLQNAQLGDVSYDFVTPHPTEGITTILTKGLCVDLQTVEPMRLEREWYSQSFIENYTYGGKLFLVTHDGSIDVQGFYGLAFNKELYATYNLEYDVYDLVNKGEWTVEALKTIVTQTVSETNTEGEMTYGLLFNLLAAQRWMWAFGGQILEKNPADGSYTLGMTLAKMDPMVTALSNLIYQSGNVLAETYDNAGFLKSKVYESFTSGRGLFVTWDLGNLYNHLRSIEFNIGYAPLPKLTASQDYAVVSPAGFDGIPSSASNYTESGVYFELCALYSNVNLKPAFFETILGGRLSDFQEDYEMLNLLHSKKIYDLGYTLDGEEEIATGLFRELLQGGETNSFAVAARLKTYQKYLNKLCRIANGEEEG